MDQEPSKGDLSVDRTLLAYERTLMAWTRTSTSLISFGFTIYKFFESFGARGEPQRLLGPEHFALLMISIGLLSLLLATLRHWQDVKELQGSSHVRPRYLPLAMAGMISCLGIIGLLSVLFRQ